MTVAALWSVLDGSATAIGLRDWLPSATDTADAANSNPTATSTTGSSAHQRHRRPQRLAIDLSIWICEAQTSTVLRNFHADPAVFLTYQRTVALLKMGIQLIAVLEGDRRGNGDGGSSNGGDGRRRRGSAGAFAAACRSCERMLTLLGVPVVLADFEGEALCALLNQRGVVDGVISNDGDCLLFGATTVYTDFSLINLTRGAVRRYEASNLRAATTAADDADPAATTHITLDRDDLIAFAILCGSDIAGDGVATMGGKKAVKFIDMCRRSDASTRTALETLRLWGAEARLHAATTMAVAAAAAASATESDFADADGNAGSVAEATKQRCCSLCLHAGDKRLHSSNGCEECGTGPGDGCYPVSLAERYKSSIKDKVMQGAATFSVSTIDAYLTPNGNTIPQTTTGASVSADLPMQQPRYQEALRSSLLFKGNTRSTSQEYLRQTMPKLLARLYILDKARSSLPENRYASSSSNFSDDVPTPRKIIGRQIKSGHPHYLLEWVLGKKEEEDQLIFVTSEWQSIVDAKMSALVDAFRRNEQKTQNEENRRAMFGQGRGGSASYSNNFGGLGGGRGGDGGNNRAGAKRRALVQGRQGGAGGKAGGGKRERSRFFASSAAAAHHDEADKPLAAGDDTQLIARFVMRKSDSRDEEECQEEKDTRDGEGHHQRKVAENRSSSDCSDLSFDEFDDFDGGESRSGGANDIVGASRNACGSESVNDLHANAGVLYETPKHQYHRGNLANPHSCLKDFASEENQEDKDGLETETKILRVVAEATDQEQPIDVRTAAAANYGQVLETPKIYCFGQLANPRVPPAKGAETAEGGLDARDGFKTPMNY